VNTARILVGVPAFRGARFIAETLRSIQAQAFGAFRVLIAVDNGDVETAEACRPFLRDSRFSLVVHDRQLGWAANINWLMGQVGEEFFCYWQQDDLASPDYLLELARHADSHASAVCVYSDIQWFGSEASRMTCPSLTGFPVNRALYFFETLNGTPFRGLIRRAAIERIEPIRLTEYESAFEELVWLARLGREGTLLRVTKPLYFKRKHDESVHVKWYERDTAWKRAVWIEFGIGMLEAIMPIVPESERDAALRVIIERLCCRREGRLRFYDPALEAKQFAVDFLTTARSRPGNAIPDPATESNQNIIRDALADLTPGGLPANLVADLQRWLRAGSPLRLTARAGEPSTSLLGDGWSFPESWGTWTDGPSASLRLPLPYPGKRWRLTFELRAFAGAVQPRRVTVRGGGRTVAEWSFASDEVHRQQLVVEASGDETSLEFCLPDAVSPSSLGMSNDQRRLGVGLLSLTISAPDERRGIWSRVAEVVRARQPHWSFRPKRY
jgi:GT2 family glycosyltransferase